VIEKEQLCPVVIVVDGEERSCDRPKEYVFSEKLRAAGASLRTYDMCCSHRRLKRIHGRDSPEMRRMIQDIPKNLVRKEG
jgi:hypothetical protein